MLASVDIQPGERVLDVACGTGIVARHAALLVGATGHVAGLDRNPDMLAVAKATSERKGVTIDWRAGQAEALPFPDADFTLVLCQFGLMFFEDPQKAVAEMHRVLASEGHIAISVWEGLDRHPFYQTLHEAIQRHLGTSSVGDIFAMGDPAKLRALLSGAGFRQVTVESVSITARFPDPEGFLAGEIDVDTAAIPAMQHLDTRARQELTEAIRGEMEGPLREVTDGDYVAIPFHAYIARAAR
jgi:ubiquinone/menaquinone biosynthesis C-methylase UbiE